MLLGVQVAHRGGEHPRGADDVRAGDGVVDHVDRLVGPHLQAPAHGVGGVVGTHGQGDHGPRIGLDQRERGLQGVLVQLVERAVAAVAHDATVGPELPVGLDVRDMLHADDDPHPRNVTVHPARPRHVSRVRGHPRHPPDTCRPAPPTMSG